MKIKHSTTSIVIMTSMTLALTWGLVSSALAAEQGFRSSYLEFDSPIVDLAADDAPAPAEGDELSPTALANGSGQNGTTIANGEAAPASNGEIAPLSLEGSPSPTIPTEVFETSMVPWSVNAHANDGSLAAYDTAYRVYYKKENATASNGAYQNKAVPALMAQDDTTFWEGSSNGNSGVCQLDFTFDKVEEFSTIVYGSRTDASLKGFATEYNVYISLDTSGENWHKVAHGTGAVTSSLCTIALTKDGSNLSAQRVRFEFLTSHGNYPSCRQMRFYKTDPYEHVLDGIWGDYAKTSFSPSVSESEIKEKLAQLTAAPGYDVKYRPYVERAQGILDGTFAYDATLERSNQHDRATDARTSDAIGCWGDVAGYARSQLKYSNNTTNRQPTGIWYPSGEEIHVWVYRENPSDPLPLIHWAQPYGYWASWHGNTTQLVEGENVLTVPTYKTRDYKTYDIVSGCVAYIENPYDEEQQSGTVKVYFEGGRHYPVYHLGDDVDVFMADLRAQADRIRADRTSDMDCVELVSNHAMLTVRATRADELYGSASHDPQASLALWEDTLKRSYEFDGISFDPEDENYDPRNEHLNENYRVSQVWDLGWMLTAGEHIGVYTGGEAEDVLIDAIDDFGNSKIAPNWGLIHEFGHSIDIPDRTIQETTNNMVANYIATRDSGMIRNLADIVRAHEMGEPDYVQGTKFAENRYNFMPFFLVESLWPGWWGKVENLYRDTAVNTKEFSTQIPKTQRFVYLASLAAGYDLSYWYEKWGLSIDVGSEQAFTYEGSCEEFKRLMEEAKTAGQIRALPTEDGYDWDEGQLPLWYIDENEFNLILDHASEPDWGNAYHGTEKPAIKRVSANGEGATISIEPMADAGEKHLLFEVYGKADGDWQLLGTTYGTTFADDTDWGETTAAPTYRVRAVDRLLHHSDFSDERAAEQTTAVAQIGGSDVTYDSFEAALEAALADETSETAETAATAAAETPTIYLLKDCTGPAHTVKLTQNLIVTARAEGPVTLYRASDEPLFQVEGTATLTFESADENGENGAGQDESYAGKDASQGRGTLILDGENSRAKDAAIVCVGNATFNANATTFKNLASSGQGSVVRYAAGGARGTFKGCTFEGCAATDGGAVFNQGLIIFDNCRFTGCSATDEGGAIRNHGGGIVKLANCTFDHNHAVHGGALSSDGLTYVSSGSFTANQGTYGGAIEFTGGNSARTLNIDGNGADTEGGSIPRFSDNESALGEALFINANAISYIGDASIEASGCAIRVNKGTLHLNAARPRNNDVDPGFTLEGTTGINGGITLANAGFVTVDKQWPAGKQTYEMLDWGRAGNIVTCEGFSGADDWSEHVLTAAGAPELEYVPNNPQEDLAENTAAAQAGSVGGGVCVVRGGEVVLHLEGGEIKSGAIEGYAAGAVTPLPTNVVKTGSSFVGWYASPDFSGNSVRSITATQKGKAEYWARWADGKYWINYQYGGGSLPADTKIYRSFDEQVVLAQPTREGFTFLGWYESKEYKGKPIAIIDAASREGDVTLYARWTHGKDKGTVIEETPATCTHEGKRVTVYACVDCKQEMEVKVETIPAKGHVWGEWKTSEEGEACGNSFSMRICETCGAMETQGLDVSKHSFGEWAVVNPATCTKDGLRTRICGICGATETQAIPALGHVFDEAETYIDEESVVAATCELPGHSDMKAACTRCGETHIVEHSEEPALGHTWSEWTITRANNCTQGVGEVSERQCETCKQYERIEKACEHAWASAPHTDVTPTCTLAGEESLHCTICGARSEVREVPALGHDFGDNLPACAICGEPNSAYREGEQDGGASDNGAPEGGNDGDESGEPAGQNGRSGEQSGEQPGESGNGFPSGDGQSGGAADGELSGGTAPTDGSSHTGNAGTPTVNSSASNGAPQANLTSSHASSELTSASDIAGCNPEEYEDTRSVALADPAQRAIDANATANSTANASKGGGAVAILLGVSTAASAIVLLIRRRTGRRWRV